MPPEVPRPTTEKGTQWLPKCINDNANKVVVQRFHPIVHMFRFPKGIFGAHIAFADAQKSFSVCPSAHCNEKEEATHFTHFMIVSHLMLLFQVGVLMYLTSRCLVLVGGQGLS